MPFYTNIQITEGPWQGSPSGLDITTNLMAATTNMAFVNDGYTVLFVNSTTTAAQTITIYSVPDNADRIADISAVSLATANNIWAFGPFRPIWWNQAGVVGLSFSGVTNISVAAVSFSN